MPSDRPDDARRPGPTGGPSAAATMVRAEVAAHQPADERERAAQRRILEELDRLADPFDEDGGPVHVTGSSIIVGSRGTVLHLHKRLGRWMQHGGHVDAGEDAAAAALRESEEETGLGLAHPAAGPLLLHVDVHPAAKGHVHLDLRYLLLGGDDDPQPPPGESQAVRWFTWDEALAVADDALRGALVSARRHLEAEPAAGAEATSVGAREEPR